MKTLHTPNFDNEFEEGGRLEASVPNSVYSKDKDSKRDEEVLNAIERMNYERVRGEIKDVVKHTIEIIHKSERYKRLIVMPNYYKITDDVIRDIYNEYHK